MSDWQLIKGKVLPTSYIPKEGQEIVICTADNRLHIEVKGMFLHQTHGGIYIRTTEGKLRYYSKAQLVFYEWAPEV